MAPTRTSPVPKKAQSPLRQSTLSFKTRKPGAALPPKAKATAKAKEEEQRRRSRNESESEAESDPVFSQSSDSEDDEVSVDTSTAQKPALDMKDKAGLYRNYYREVQEKMGWISPIHNEGQTKIHNMLCVFDNTYEYGPCAGLTRLQRWERAEAMGLNPPPEVRDILLTKEGSENPTLVHNVFHGLV